MAATVTFDEKPNMQADAGDPRTDNDKVQIREAINDIQTDFPSGGGGVCAELSKAGERELANSGLTQPPDCTRTVFELVQRNEAAGIEPFRSTIKSITIEGNRAVAFLEPTRRWSGSVPLVKEGSRGWRVLSLRYVEPVGEALGL